MRTKTPVFLFLLLFSINGFSQSSPFIHVDQFGYLEDAEKVAVISDPLIGYNSAASFIPSATLEVRDAETDAVVFSGSPSIWNNGNTHASSGDRGWWFDFSTLTTAGTYYIYDAGNDESSAEFDIDNNVYTEVIKAAGRMFFYNRCGHTKEAPYAEAGWTDLNSFTQDANCKSIESPNDASLQKDLSGGWFDAGDYNKYVTFTSSVLHDLLWAYQDNNDIFTDDWNIPESGNGIPDIIDEVKWELDWLQKMVNADGSVIIKMGSQNYAENSAAPPSANTDDRFYGPTCSSAAISAAATLAHAAKVFGEFPSLVTYSEGLEEKAIAAWDYVLPFLNNNNLEEDCDDGSIVSGDADRDAAEQKEEALIAATHLFDLTGNNSYSQYLTDHIDDASIMNSNDWSAYKLNLADALLLYTTISGSDANTSDDIISSITTSVTNNWNNYYGFNEDDLYRAFVPSWTYHWGSNNQKSAYGSLNQLLLKYGINSGNSASYQQKVAEQIHYFHGVNPQGMVYLSNMYDLGAEHCVNEIYHGWFADGTDWDNAQTSTYGPPPGYVTGGPNDGFTGPLSLIPPHNQPAQKSYLDWNSGWPENSWEITEPAIYYQASFIRLLATTEVEIPLPVEWLDKPRAKLVNGDVHINWFTSSEVFNDRFEIEHSLDAKNYSKIGNVNGTGNSSVTNRYKFIHPNAPAGLNYYRIKQIDYDGKFEYSPNLSILVKERIPFSLFPNPANERVILKGESSDYLVYLFNGSGTKMATFDFTGSELKIDLSKFKTGLYVLEVMDLKARKSEALRFLKE